MGANIAKLPNYVAASPEPREPLNDHDVLTHQGEHKNRQEQKAEGNEFGIEGHNMLSTPQGQPPVHSIATAI